MKQLVTFTASWCGPCKMLKPVLAKLEADGSITWKNYDIDENQDYAREMGIKSVPALLLYQEEKLIATFYGGA